MSTMVDEFRDVIEFARVNPQWSDGFLHALDGVVDFLNLNPDEDVPKCSEILGNLLAVFKEHVA